MITMCILLLNMSKPAPYDVKCSQVNDKQLEHAKMACAVAAKDPVSTCDPFVTADGSRWFFVYQSAN
jgi:hypothetical protein